MPIKWIRILIKNILPPILTNTYIILRDLQRNNLGVLFDGNDRVFKTLVEKAKVYAEYGTGKSTLWVLENTDAEVVTVDSNSHWIDFVKKKLGSPKRFHGIHVDVGELENWGRPTGYSKRDNFKRYTDVLWEDDIKPDMVLIDGRFRVCCFLTSIKYGNTGTKIVFDDYYSDRRNIYHIVEEFITPNLRHGRQAIFEIPAKDGIDMETLDQYIASFRLVMD